MIETRNMLLVPCTSMYLNAFMECKYKLEQLLGVKVPDGWPILPELLLVWQEELARDSALACWVNWLYIEKASKTLVGDGGFKGKPDANGTVEIGYAVLPEYRNRGLASEAAGGLTHWVFCQPEATKIIAHTSIDGTASQRVLMKNGFLQEGKYFDPVDGELIRWGLTRERYLKLQPH